MNRNFRSASLIVFCLFVLFYNGIKADYKQFARSYTAYTLPANSVEFEFWQTGRIDKGLGYYYRWQPRFEVEYGVSDRLTASMYFNFNEVKSTGNTFSSKPFSYSTTSFEFRYRLSNPNEYFVDPALYFEFGYGGDKIFYEPKLLFSKRINRVTTVANIISEIERFPTKSETESKFELTAGVAYELNANLSLGLEFRNHHNFEKIYEKKLNQASFLGPTISFFSKNLYFVMNFMFQVSGSPDTKNGLELIGHEKYEIRSILGVSI